jgi:hypothetical protein
MLFIEFVARFLSFPKSSLLVHLGLGVHPEPCPDFSTCSDSNVSSAFYPVQLKFIEKYFKPRELKLASVMSYFCSDTFNRITLAVAQIAQEVTNLCPVFGKGEKDGG